jgi:hypothetical protein
MPGKPITTKNIINAPVSNTNITAFKVFKRNLNIVRMCLSILIKLILVIQGV